MKKFFKSVGSKVAAVGAVVMAGASSASAAVTLPTAVETGDVLAWAGVILVGIAAIWPIKKLIALGNKS